MVSARRAARAGAGRAAPAEAEPEWLRHWIRDEWTDNRGRTPSEVPEEEFIASAMQARRRWKDACADWYRCHGRPLPWELVGYGTNPEPMTWREWNDRYGGTPSVTQAAETRQLLPPARRGG